MKTVQDSKTATTERYEVTEEDKAFGPPNAERRGVSRILANSSIVAIAILAVVGIYMVV
jgi:hypothetical protein